LVYERAIRKNHIGPPLNEQLKQTFHLRGFPDIILVAKDQHVLYGLGDRVLEITGIAEISLVDVDIEETSLVRWQTVHKPPDDRHCVV
jgi:hypothetical protein